MIFAVAIGVLSALVVLIAMVRVDIKKFMGYPAAMDILVTVLLMWMLHGSYVGMVAAVIGGLFFTLIITLCRKLYGYKRLQRVGIRPAWVEYPAEWLVHIPQLAQVSGYKEEGKVECLKFTLPKLLIASIAVLFVLASVL